MLFLCRTFDEAEAAQVFECPNAVVLYLRAVVHKPQMLLGIQHADTCS